MRRGGREVMRRGAVKSWGARAMELWGEGQGHVAACAGSTGTPAIGEAAAPRGVGSAQRSAVTRQVSRWSGRPRERVGRE